MTNYHCHCYRYNNRYYHCCSSNLENTETFIHRSWPTQFMPQIMLPDVNCATSVHKRKPKRNKGALQTSWPSALFLAHTALKRRLSGGVTCSVSVGNARKAVRVTAEQDIKALPAVIYYRKWVTLLLESSVSPEFSWKIGCLTGSKVEWWGW